MRNIWVLTDQENTIRFLWALKDHSVLFLKNADDLIKKLKDQSPDIIFADSLQLLMHANVLKENMKKDIQLIITSRQESEELWDFFKEVEPEDIMLGQLTEEHISAKIACCHKRSAKIIPIPKQIHHSLSNLLTKKERKILEYLIETPGIYISKDKITTQVWGETIVCPKTIEVHISNIRKKIRPLKMEIDYSSTRGFCLISRESGNLRPTTL